MKTSFALAAVLALACQAAPAFAQGTPAPAPAPKSEAPKPAAQPETPKPAPAPAPAATPGAAPEAPKQEQALQYVTMTTSMGDIVIELNAEKAPLSVANFLTYVDKGFYDGTIFHRVMPGFMIQGGGFTPDMAQKPTGPGVKNEWKNGLKNVRGAIAMARTNIADSGTSQFFINVVDNAMLDQPNDGAAYAVFGKVVSGMDVVDKIKAVPTGNKGMHQNVPTQTVEIKSVKRSEAPASDKK
jgi:peptidyl-prolyl cis-trans isomerase A (cyclophilin A)